MASEAQPLKFEQALAELDRVVRELEDGNTTLEDALARYARGIALVNQCHQQLNSAKLRIKELTGIGEDGKPKLEDFEHTSAVEKATRRANSP